MLNKKTLGFTWDASIIPTKLPTPDIKRACFRVKKLLPEFVFDTIALENNPFTFAEVKTLLEGVTVGGHTLSDEQQVLNQAESWKHLLSLVEQQKLVLNKETFCTLSSIVAKEESLEWGIFRNNSVSIAGTKHTPPTADKLDAIFQQGQQYLLTLANPLEQGIAFFLFGALQQFFYDGNKRTARLMMNGVLLSHGQNAISIPASSKQEFNEKMIRFYDSQNGGEMFEFMLSLFNSASAKQH